MSRFSAGKGHSVVGVVRPVILAGALAAMMAACPFGSARAAGVETTGRCDKPLNFGIGTEAHITQARGRAMIEIVYPAAAGRKIDVEYGDELYSRKFGDDGVIRLAFALTAAENTFTVSLSEMAPVTCSLSVPDFDKYYRVILRWHDPIKLDLHVVEPNGRLNETGHVTSKRPNNDHTQGIGEIDIVGVPPTGDEVGETSYVVDAKSVPTDGVFSFKVDFVSRGSDAVPPYCGDNALATPRIDFIKIQAGTVSVSRMSLNRARCQEKIPDNRRLIPLR